MAPAPSARLVAPLLLVVALIAAAVVVVPRLIGDDEVLLADREVSGLDDAALRAVVAELATSLPTTPVTLETGGATLSSTAAALGVSLDAEATLAALAEIDDGDVDPVVVVDPDAVAGTLATLDTSRTALREPTIVLSGAQFVAQPGEAGQGLDADEVVVGLQEADWGFATPVTLEVESRPLEPRHTLADAEALATRANAATAAPLEVAAGTVTTSVPPDRLRAWVRAVPGDALVLGVAPDVVAADLASLLAGATTSATDATFDVVDGAPRIVPGVPGTACCGPEAPSVVLGALLARPTGAVALPLVETEPARSTATLEALGIIEEVGSFTTRHNAGEPRVQNIHRVADIMRGYVLNPGDTLSMNGILGERTIEKGYVAAPAIVDGNLRAEVGGGISQFMTTIFNAAFFAGLEFGEYQSHTIYISRYPYGREATINWQRPDLQIRNSTPHGVLVWPTYTNTTITVTLYSTRVFAEVEQTGQRVVKSGVSCDSVTTERTRTYLDGRTEVDTVRALYRPENTRCDGSNITPTTTTTTTTTVPPTTAPPTTPGPTTVVPTTVVPTTAAPPTTAPPTTVAEPTTTVPTSAATDTTPAAAG